MDDDTRVEWRPWGAAAFDEADRRGAPVLLSLTATWCGACHEMDRETYAEPRIAANVNDGFVPVRVDGDRHPRVRERYNMGGFPTTAFLTPSGDLITGATYLGPDGFRQVLDSVRERWDASGEAAGRVPRALAGDPTPAGEVTPAIEANVAGQLEEKYDPRHAGWGSEAKFPMPRTVEFALKRERDQALRTLEAVSEALLDDVEGGFHRYADRADWTGVNREKLLDSNAALLRAFANGYLYTGDERYRRPAERTVEYLVEALWTGAGFGGSQGPAENREYYELDAAGRAEATPPRTDLTVYAGANGLTADALLTYHAYTDDGTARRYADRTLDALEGLIDGGVVTHYAGDGESEACLLEDQARVAAAFARAEQVVGRGLSTARAVADTALERLHDEGSFRDGPAAGPGLLDRPLRPIDGNVEMATALLDLAALTGEERYREAARETVAAFAGAADRIGVQVAGYGAAAARLCRDDLVVAVGTDAGTDLHRAALRVADHERVVRPGAHRADAFDVGAGSALVRRGDRERTVGTPDELMAAVADVTGSE